MSVEQQLRGWFRDRAATVVPAADLVDLMVRADRRARRRTRAVVAGLVAAVVAGPLAGIAIGRASSTGDGSRVVASAPGSGSSATASIGTPSHKGSSVTANNGLEALFARTTRDGVTVRAYQSVYHCPADVACTTPLRPAVIQAEMSTAAAVTLVTTSPNAAATTPLGWVTSGLFGVREGAPSQWVLVQTGPNASDVRVRFASGETDRMAPVGDVAILAHGGASSARVEVVSHSGDVLASRDIPAPSGSCGDSGVSQSAEGSQTIDSGCRASVVPGPIVSPVPNVNPLPTAPTLPAPGVQPGDAGQARTAVMDAFTTAYKGDTSGSARASAIDNNAGVAALLDEVARGPYASSVKISWARVTQIVFTSPEHATVLYDVLLGSQIDFASRVGQAVLTNGRWRVARTTICSDLVLAGAPCG